MSHRSVPGSLDLARAWKAVLGRLELELNPRTFNAWLRDTRPVRLEGSRLLVETQDNLALPWLNERLAFVVHRALCAVFDADVHVEFVGHGYAANGHEPAEGDSAAPAAGDSSSSLRGLIGRVNRRHALDRYVPARGNRLALDCCLAVLGDNEFAPASVAIWGGPGLGKTHLLHGTAMRAQAMGWPTACLSAEEFTSRYQQALRAKDVEDFQSSLRSVRLFVLDDLQYLVGKRATQDELVHTIDAVCDQGGHVIVAGELHPLELDLPERLTTRLSAGVVARIEPFELQERRTFVECVARHLRAALPGWAIDRIAALGDVPVRLVQGGVHCAIMLQRSGMLEPGRLDLELSRLALTELTPAAATPEQVLEAVARQYDATASDLRGRSRKPSHSSARAVAAALLQERGKSLSEIASVLGGRNRTTISPIVARGKRLLEAEPELRSRLAG